MDIREELLKIRAMVDAVLSELEPKAIEKPVIQVLNNINTDLVGDGVAQEGILLGVEKVSEKCVRLKINHLGSEKYLVVVPNATNQSHCQKLKPSSKENFWDDVLNLRGGKLKFCVRYNESYRNLWVLDYSR